MPRWRPAHRRHLRRQRGLALRAGAAGSYPRLDVDAALAAAQRGDARLARRRAAGARGGLRRDRRRDQPRAFEIANAVMHTTRPAVRHVLPGRWTARPGPGVRGDRRGARRAGARADLRGLGEAGQGRADPHAQGLPHRPARRRARDRLQHLPDVERLPRHLRLAGHRQPGHRQAAPAGGAAARDHRGDRPKGAAGQTASTRPSCSSPPESDGEGLAKTLAERPEVAIIDYTGGPGSGLARARGSSGAASSSTPRSPASTRSSSTRPTTCAACWATSRSRSRSTPARCARRRRTSTSPADGIDTDEGHLSFEEFGDRLAGR